MPLSLRPLFPSLSRLLASAGFCLSLAPGCFAGPSASPGLSSTQPQLSLRSYAEISRLSFGELKKQLEQAGWPAAHVQALLGAEIQQRLNPPVTLTAADLRPFTFWHTGPDALPLAPSARDRTDQQSTREEAARNAFDELFPPTSHEDPNAALLAWEEQRRWGELSLEKRAAVSTALDAAENARHLLVSTRGGLLTRDEWDAAWKITEQSRTALASILTAEELLDFDLRNSTTAERMRNELDSFHPSREEFLTIFKRRHPLELRFGHKPPGIDSNIDAERSSAEREVEKRIAASLGPARYDDYRLSLDPACQTLRFDGRFARTDAATVRRLYRSLLATKTRLARLDPSLPPDRRSAETASLKDSLYREFRAVLDEEATRRYLQEQSLWP